MLAWLFVPVTCAQLVLAGCSKAPAEPEDGGSNGAGAVILQQTLHELSVEFTDSNGWTMIVDFDRDHEKDIWVPRDMAAGEMLVFGREDLVLPDPATIENPAGALATFDPGIAGETFDDISIFDLSGSMAFLLWEDGEVREIHLAGTTMLMNLEETLPADPTQDPDFCDSLRAHCLNDDVQACTALARFCPEEKEFACHQLLLLCQGNDPEDTEDDNVEACIAGAQFCNENPPPPPPPSREELIIIELLETILEILEEILPDLQQNGGQ